VIVGGSQPPAAWYTWTGWDTGSYCNSPKASVEVYVRWYVTKVENAKTYIEKIYISHKSPRSGPWDHIRLSYRDAVYAGKNNMGGAEGQPD
jgi:hypothetical protein